MSGMSTSMKKLDPEVLRLHKLSKLKPPRPEADKWWDFVIDFLSRADMQFVFYVIFLGCFSMLGRRVRSPKEYIYATNIRDNFVEQAFDNYGKTFDGIARIADFWEWSNFVFVPGLFSMAGVPFDSHKLEAYPYTDDAYTTSDFRMQSSYTDFVGGIQFRQMRTKPLIFETGGMEVEIIPTLMDTSIFEGGKIM